MGVALEVEKEGATWQWAVPENRSTAQRPGGCLMGFRLHQAGSSTKYQKWESEQSDGRCWLHQAMMSGLGTRV